MAARPALSSTDRETLRALAEALVPTGGPIAIGGVEAGADQKLAERIDSLGPGTTRRLLALIRLFAYSAALGGGFRRFSRQSPEVRLESLERALRSRWRGALLEPLQALLLMSTVSCPEVEAALSFDSSCVDSSPPRRGARLHPRQYPDLSGDVELSADACIVGSGAGGAAVAKELAEAGLRVVVIEEGGYFTQEDFHGPPFDRMLRFYRDHGMTFALGRRPVPVPLGACVGGTTVVNSGTCFRTPDEVLRAWGTDFGLEGFDPESMRPVFDRVEETLRVKPVPWEIIGENAKIFDRGVHALGLHGEPIRRNIDGCRGCGVCAFGCPSDAKQAMHLSYLPLAEKAGAEILSRCRVEAIEVEGKRVRAVRASILGPAPDDEVKGRLRIRAGIVVLAAGAIHTPVLLLGSGIGNRSVIGTNLRLHPSLGVGALFRDPVYAWRGTMQSYFVDELQRSDGVMIEVTNPVPVVAVGMFREVGLALKQRLATLPFTATAGLFVADHSSGRVRRTPRGGALMTYSLVGPDAARLLRGIALVAEIFFAAGATEVVTPLRRKPRLGSQREIEELRLMTVRPAELQVTGFHPMGTCRMGRDPEHSVVAPSGSLHGVDNLYVADGSLFPTCVGVNPQISIVAFATRIAAGIAEREGSAGA